MGSFFSAAICSAIGYYFNNSRDAWSEREAFSLSNGDQHNKRLQLDNLQAVRFAVSLSLHFTAKRPSYKLRLKRALALKVKILDVALHLQLAKL